MAELADALVSGTSVGTTCRFKPCSGTFCVCAGGEIGIHATLRGSAGNGM